jgi:hypothetical protein
MQLRSCHTISVTDLFCAVVAQTQRDLEKLVAACFVPSQGRPDISIRLLTGSILDRDMQAYGITNGRTTKSLKGFFCLLLQRPHG